MTTIPAHWAQSFYDAEYVKSWHRRGAFDATAIEAEAIADLLDLEVGASVLDVACGFGRIAGALHRRGLVVTGVDIVPSQVAMALQWNPGPTYVCADMRALPRGPWDGVVCHYSSFGVLESAAADRECLRTWREALTERGALVLSTVTAENFVTGQADGVTVNWREEVAEIRDSRGRCAYLRLYGALELKRLLTYVGFTHVDLYGDLRRGPYRAGGTAVYHARV